METVNFEFNFNELNITWADFQRIAPMETQGMEAFMDVLDEVFIWAESSIHAKGGYRILDVIHLEKESLVLEEAFFYIGKIITKQLRKSQKIIVFACTAGTGIRVEYEKQQKAGDLLKAFLIDTLGTVIVEKAMDKIHHEIESTFLKQVLHCSNRYSPGYCGWNVSEQHKLLKLLPLGYCGITLTESALMLPVKSISGIIGLGREMHRLPYTCSICTLEHCIYRQNKKT
jgi:hypothetical protein